MTADFRALCAELTEFVGRLTSHYYEPAELLTRARAALADEPPEPIPPAALPEGYIDPEHSGDDRALLQTFYSACQAEGGTADEVTLHGLRAVLARWGNHVPAPPADGEVADVVRWLKARAGIPASPDFPAVAAYLTRAAELLERQVVVPVAASERLPEPSTKVLAHYVNDLGKGRTICAIWVPAKTRSDEGGHDDFTEYDEEDDKFYWPEGWYEAIENWDEFGYVKVYEGEVDYWQPLPKRPAHALPLPEVGE